MNPNPFSRRAPLRLEQLEGRDAPATLVSPTKISYQDFDGDNVTVTFSRAILTSVAVANNVFTFNTGSANDGNATKQQLKTINLAAVWRTCRGDDDQDCGHAQRVDGRRRLRGGGLYQCVEHRSGAVIIDGDLTKIVCGDGTTTTSGLKGLTVQSMGRYGLSTAVPDVIATINGKLDSLKVKADVKAIDFQVNGPAADAKIGSILIGGSLIGGSKFRRGSHRGAGRHWADRGRR